MGVRRNPYKAGESWKTGASSKQSNMEAYLDWLLTPKAERVPATKGGFAESIGVTYQTLRNYERERWFQAELDRRSRGLFKAARMQDVIDTMFKIATDVGHKNAVTAARLLVDWSSRASQDETDAQVESLSLAELIEKINMLAESEAVDVGD